MKKSSSIPYWIAAILAVLIIVFTPKANAQQLKVATGFASNTYSKMLKELSGVCGTSIGIVEQNSSGSMDNVNLLTGNAVNAAFVQNDVLAFRAQTEDLGNIKTLATLHPEEVHVLALAVSKLTQGGVMGVGAKPVVFNTVKDLRGLRVGAVGGSAITAQVIRLQSEIDFKVVEFPDNKALVGAITKGDVEAGLFVGGAPLGTVAELQGDGWKLLPFPEDVMGKLKAVYRPARLNYAKIKQMGVQTVAAEALFVTREYKTAKMTDGLAKLRSCFRDQVGELAETTGMHPKWQAVNIDNRGKWPYYDLPEVSTAAAPVKRK